MLKYRNQVAYVLYGNSLTITPADNESLRILFIGYDGYSADTEATITIDRTKVGYHLPYFMGQAQFPGLKEDLMEISPYQNPVFDEVDLSYPVANGESFNVSTTTSGNIFVVYDIYDAGDVKNTEVNGTNSPVLNFLQYITNASAITTATTLGYTEFDKNKNPTDFPKFPIQPVPAGQEFDIHAIGNLALSRGNGSVNVGYSKYLRLKYNREVLFDESGYGFLSQGLSSYVTNGYSASGGINTVPYKAKYNNYIKRFDVPITFIQGDELDVELGHMAGTAGTIEAGKTMAWMLMTQRRL